MLRPMRTAEAMIEEPGNGVLSSVRRDRRARLQRRERAGRERPAAAGLSRSSPSPSRASSPWSTTAAPTPPRLVAAGLAAELDGVRALRLTGKGRGRALRAVWSTSSAQVVAYMDVDLSTSLDALLPLVAPLLSGHSDVAIGTRLARGARVVRGPKRELISRIYNLLLKTFLRNGFSDAQCGFKAARTEVAKTLLPYVEDNEWFFDTEFLVLAERQRLSHPRGPRRLGRRPRQPGRHRADGARRPPGAGPTVSGQARGRRVRPALNPVGSDLPSSVANFARIGVVSTAVYLVLFFVLAGPLGRLGANALALALCTAANTRRPPALHLRPAGRAVRRNLVLGGVAALVDQRGASRRWPWPRWTVWAWIRLLVVGSVLIAGQRRGRPRALRRSAGMDVPGGHPRADHHDLRPGAAGPALFDERRTG